MRLIGLEHSWPAHLRDYSRISLRMFKKQQSINVDVDNLESSVLADDVAFIRHGQNIALLCIAVMLVPVFIYWIQWQEGHQKPALIPSRLWRNQVFTSICVMVFLSWAQTQALEFYFSLL